MCGLKEFDNPIQYPNVAVLRFAKLHDNVHSDIERLTRDRSILDLPALILAWLAFVWGTTGASNPLLNGTGLPSAAFVETVFAMAGFELTPGLSSASSCPEAIWQSAKWWANFYKQPNVHSDDGKKKLDKSSPSPAAVSMVPTGFFTIRQSSAAILDQNK
jgi:hypothetical protein